MLVTCLVQQFKSCYIATTIETCIFWDFQFISDHNPEISKSFTTDGVESLFMTHASTLPTETESERTIVPVEGGREGSAARHGFAAAAAVQGQQTAGQPSKTESKLMPRPLLANKCSL